MQTSSERRRRRQANTNVQVVDLHETKEQDSFRADVLAGLAMPQKTIPPKYLYDAKGSSLFDQICDLDEYYLTRAEVGLLKRHANEMAMLLGSRCLLIEFGSGSSLKSRVLLNALKSPAAYMPIDISRAALLQSANELASDFPSLNISAVCADFTVPLTLPDRLCSGASRRVGFFPGSTIGNFDPPDALRLLKRIGALLRPKGRLLIGIDLLKSPTLLEPAYNDAKHVTAAFNLNLLHRINRELDANFKVASFRHFACFNPAKSRVEMHLESLIRQEVEVAGHVFHFESGETIHTESSYKYSHEVFTDMANAAGYAVALAWVSPSPLFAIYCLEVQRESPVD